LPPRRWPCPSVGANLLADLADELTGFIENRLGATLRHPEIGRDTLLLEEIVGHLQTEANQHTKQEFYHASASSAARGADLI